MATGTTTPNAPNGEFLRQRLYSLDMYRGIIMVTLAFAGFGLAESSVRMQKYLATQTDVTEIPRVWEDLEHHFAHVKWAGCSYWDMIQPSFMFMVGVAMAYSYLKRERLGHGYVRMFAHAIWRAVVLVLLGVFLSSNGSSQTNWSFMNVLSQIGLGYPFLFMCRGSKPLVHGLIIVALLGGTWALYQFYEDAGIDREKGNPEVKVSAEFAQEYLGKVDPAWHKNANIGHYLDGQLLNAFPRRETFVANAGGYQTINFIPSLATMLLGLMCGELLRSASRSSKFKLFAMLVGGSVCVGAGVLLHLSGACPLVKRIWTPSWALFSGGLCIWTLMLLFTIVDVMRIRFLAWPFVVVGVNSIAIYMMAQMLKPWTARLLQTHLGKNVFQLDFNIGGFEQGPLPVSQTVLEHFKVFEPTIKACLVGLMFWLVCLYLYRRRIFIRI